MESQTKITAEDGTQELKITREFDLPLELLYKAHAEPELVSQWMGTKVLKLESKPHGSWEFETADPQGNVVFRAHGVIHEFIPDQKITRTFEMEGGPFGAQLEFYDFQKLTAQTSSLTIHIIYKSVEIRNQILQMPFAFGLNMAHNRLQEIAGKLI